MREKTRELQAKQRKQKINWKDLTLKSKLAFAANEKLIKM